MKNYTIVFTRANASEPFPDASNPAVAAHVAATYLGNPLRLVGVGSEISDDLLTLTVIRKFATEADATAYSQDPVITAWVSALPTSSAGIAA